MKTLIAAAVLVVLPSVAAFAECGSHSAQTMSCAEGQVWDAPTRACVDRTTS